MTTVLHVAPHADDELIGAPATLMALRDSGYRVVNLACSLGRPEEAGRRSEELAEACRRAGFTDERMSPPLGDRLGPHDVTGAVEQASDALREAIGRHRPLLVVSPSPHDRHRGHEVVGRAVMSALGAGNDDTPAAVWWMWGLWADLPMPTTITPFTEQRLTEILHALEAHQGELARNDYRRLVRGRAEMNASLGPERVFGFGAPARSGYAELVTEVTRIGESWRLGPRRWFEAGDRVPGPGAAGRDVSGWLEGPSITELHGIPGDRPG